MSGAQMEARGAAANRLKIWTRERLTTTDGDAVKRASVSLSARGMTSKGQEQRRPLTICVPLRPGEEVFQPYVVKSGFNNQSESTRPES